MNISKRSFMKSLLAISVLAAAGIHSNPAYSSNEKIKLGFLVKQPEEP